MFLDLVVSVDSVDTSHLRQDECLITYARLIEIIKCGIPIIPLNLGLNWNSVFSSPEPKAHR